MKAWLKIIEFEKALPPGIRSLFIIKCCLFAAQLSPAQFLNKYTPTHYSIENGLTNNTIAQVRQDGNGFMWFNDHSSIIRFDGNEFKYYKHNKNDSLMKIGPDVINNIIIDHKGTLWINHLETAFGALNSNKSLLKYDLTLDGFIQYKPKVNSFVRTLSPEDSDTLIWLGSRTEGLYLFNTVTGETRNFPNKNDEQEFYDQNNHVRSIINNKDQLILTTINGLWMFDKKTHSYSRGKNLPEAFYSGSLGSLRTGWIVNWKYTDSIEVYKPDHLLNITKKISLPPFVINVTIDQYENIVILKNKPDDPYRKAFFLSSENQLEEIPFNPEKEKIPFSANDSWIDNEGNIWITSGLGITKYTKLRIPYEVIEMPDEYTDGYLTIVEINKVKTAVFHGSNNYIATTPIPIKKSSVKDFNFEGKHDRYSNINFSFQGKNNLWIASWFRGVLKIPIDTIQNTASEKGAQFLEPVAGNPYSLSSPYAWCVYEDTEGYVWVGHFDKGIDKIDPRMPYGSEGSIKRFLHDPQNQESLSSDLVQNIIADNDGTILIGTGVGIDQFSAGKFKRLWNTGERMSLIKTNNGEIFAYSFSNSIYKIYKDGELYQFKDLNIGDIGSIYDVNNDEKDRIWITTSLGLVMYEPKLNLLCKLFHEPAVRKSFEIRKFSDSQYILSKSDHLISFNPNAFDVDATSVNVVLTALKINNKTVNRLTPGISKLVKENITTVKEITLDYWNNNFSLEFTALSFSSPTNILYKHMLVGYDKEWIENDSKNRSATYTNLPPGDYVFKVKASNHHGVWSEVEKTLKVKILPPPWRTWWAYSGYLMLVAGLLVWARRNIVQRERLKASLDLSKVEQEKEHFELEKAKEVDRLKTYFFTNISHEFRTPLTLIKGPVDTLLERFNHDPDVIQRLKLVQRNSDLLLKLINQLLDLAKLESGSLKVEKSEGDVFSFVRAIASSFESFARQKDVSVIVDVPSETCAALFDKDKLETILINLVNNAIKFMPANGSVTVSASVENSQLHLKVIDTGIGISEEQQSKIFERFHQVSEAHKEVGTGIGLSLVKELVALMEGEIDVISEVDKGSEFVVTIPIELVASHRLPITSDHHDSHREPVTSNQQPVTSQNLQGDEQTAKPHVLVVEDNADLRAFIIDSLGDEFYFLEAENGRIGLEVATREIPDLIISDVMMPEMDGITMAGKIKTDIRTSHIPLILLTAKSSEDSKLSGLQSGADDYLTKPFNKNELLLKVRNGVSRQLKLREKLRAELMSTAPKIEVLSEDEKFLNSVKEKILDRLSDEQLSVESLADDIGMSRVQLYRKVSGLTGISVNELIRKLRLQRAAQLLQQNWGPVSQIAYEVGFSNLSYFSKVFKEEFGTLPSEYVEKI